MIDGNDANDSEQNLIAFTNFPSPAYSYKYIAEPTPIGVAINTAKNVT